jgi:uncharacterized membrane protein YgaE (UPF0421/DUF939 family)
MKLKNITIKTGISVFLCITISKLLKLKYPFFVVLPSFVPISNSAAESLKAGRNRMLGTLIGALVGVLFAFIKPGSAVLCGIGMIVIIYLCNYIRWGSSASIAGLVFMSIMISIKQEQLIAYGIDRISNTLIGIIVTIVVNNLIFRTNFVAEVDNSCRRIRLMSLDSIKEKIHHNNEVDLNKLDDEIEKTKKELNNYLQEYVLRKKNRQRIDELKRAMDRLVCISRHLKIVCSVDETFALNDENHEIFGGLLNMDLRHEKYINSEESIVFNYHLKKIFQELLFIDEILNEED